MRVSLLTHYLLKKIASGRAGQKIMTTIPVVCLRLFLGDIKFWNLKTYKQEQKLAANLLIFLENRIYVYAIK